PWFNLFFFVLLLVFAASFLGAFELTLPSSWVNKMDRNSDRGGLVGIFFMAFTLALVSFSCTGPFVGTVLVEAATTGDFWGPIVGMIGFSSALALPFTLFAIFPGWLSSLPKSGGWLNSVKVVLGFIELAFALKFLSNTDMVWDMRILTREVFIALWVVIFTLLGMYLLGKIRLPHDSPVESIGVGRLFLSLISLSFAVYMLPGIWGAPVKIISAFAPPLEYSETGGKSLTMGDVAAIAPAIDGMHEGPQGIPVFTDMEKARRYAESVGKPLLLDFTGKACVNCRKMEADVWSDSCVKEILTRDFVVAELFVDFRESLPESEQYVSSTGKKIKTVGQKWSDYQIQRFGINAQPYYVILDDNDSVIAPTRGMDTDVEAYIQWLTEARKAYNK
ncbi:MAG: thioredoxin family protein, partial [Flavobacteriales bacterium]|nr:thioredoxin family protein [Flavobacteriales bacterium]